MKSKKGDIIGYTTGVFDLFHVGHLNLLKKARNMCDKLIVGVYSDEIVLSYKTALPLIPHKQRIAIVSSIKYVDKVISPEARDDKLGQWNKYKFHIYFMGNDWQGTERWNRIEREFKNVGVRVVYIAYTKNITSSSLKKKLLSVA